MWETGPQNMALFHTDYNFIIEIPPTLRNVCTIDKVECTIYSVYYV